MSPGGDRVAYVSLDEVNPGILCPRTRAVVLPNSAPGAPEPLPPLVSARIIVRGIDAITGEALDPQAVIAFPGVEPRTAAELPLPNVAPGVPRWLVRFYVFQNDFNSGGPLAYNAGLVSGNQSGGIYNFSNTAGADVPTPGIIPSTAATQRMMSIGTSNCRGPSVVSGVSALMPKIKAIIRLNAMVAGTPVNSASMEAIT